MTVIFNVTKTWEGTYMEKEKLRVVVIPEAKTLMEMKGKIMRVKGIDLPAVMRKMGITAGNDFFEHCIKEVRGKKNRIKSHFHYVLCRFLLCGC